MTKDKVWDWRQFDYEEEIAEGFHDRAKSIAMRSLRTHEDMTSAELQALADLYQCPFDDGTRRFEPRTASPTRERGEATSVVVQLGQGVEEDEQC